MSKKKLSSKESESLLRTLKTRFEKNMNRHKSLKWIDIETKLSKQADKLAVLNQMEETGGEPDVIGFDKKSGLYTFCDCSAESPKERRSEGFR